MLKFKQFLTEHTYTKYNANTERLKDHVKTITDLQNNNHTDSQISTHMMLHHDVKVSADHLKTARKNGIIPNRTQPIPPPEEARPKRKSSPRFWDERKKRRLLLLHKHGMSIDDINTSLGVKGPQSSFKARKELGLVKPKAKINMKPEHVAFARALMKTKHPVKHFDKTRMLDAGMGHIATELNKKFGTSYNEWQLRHQKRKGNL